MKKIMVVLGLVGSLGLNVAQGVLIADFDTGSKPNNVGGDFGAWDKDSADKTQYCREGFDNVNTRTGTGYSMRLSYDVDSPNAAYNGFWMKLGNTDATQSKKIVLWVKGDDKKGGTSRLKVELKNASEHSSCYIDGISKQWTKFELPLNKFEVTDMAALTEIVFVFEDNNSMPKEGIIYLDDISIE